MSSEAMESTQQILIRYLGYFIYWVFFYFLIVYTRPVYIEFIIKSFSGIRYNNDLTSEALASNHIALMAYVLVSLYWNKKTLAAIGNSSKLMWAINGMIDHLLIPLSFLIMVIYNNITKSTISNLSSIENIFLMGLLMAFKNFIIKSFLPKKAVSR